MLDSRRNDSRLVRDNLEGYKSLFKKAEKNKKSNGVCKVTKKIYFNRFNFWKLSRLKIA